ncbi:hypothetical protein [Desulfoplanes sp.]
MSENLEFQWEWLSPFEPSSVEGLTFADMKISVGGRAVTELEDDRSQTLRKGMYISAYPLALFLAANWWRLRWEPKPLQEDPEWRMRHCLPAIGEGYVWPDLTFTSDGEGILLTVRSREKSRTSPVRYIADFSAWVPAKSFEGAIRHCIEGVLSRLDAVGMTNTDLVDLWDEVRKENDDFAIARMRRIEALAGYDPDEAPESFVRDLLNTESEVGLPAIQELAAASKNRALDDLKLLQESLQTKGVDFQIADFNRLVSDAQPKQSSATPWQQAYAAAQKVRDIWGLAEEPISNIRLADLVGVHRNVLEDDHESGRVLHAPYSASTWNRENDDRRLILNRKPVTSRRFAICRLVGDRLLGMDDGRLSAATDAGTSRQKFQRAFAQGLLCPFDALMDFIGKAVPSDDDIEDAAAHFLVSPRLVYTTLVNHHVLPREIVFG